MPVFRVIRKTDKATVYAYSSDVAVEFPNLPFAEFDHIEEIAVNPDRTIDQLPARNITKLEYLRRFTQAERVAIRETAKTTPVLEDYLAMLELAQDISLDDADTMAAVNMLEAVGLIASGRAAEILA